MKITSNYSIILDKELSNWHIYVLMILLNIFLAFVMNNYFLSREVIIRLYSQYNDISSINIYLLTMKKYSFLGYALIPIIILIRIVLVALIAQLFFMLRLKEISFNKLFRIVLIGYGIIVFSSFIQLIILFLTPTETLSLESLAMAPLSLSHLVSTENMDKVYNGFLNQINVFEILWIITIAVGLKSISGIKSNTASIVAISIWFMIFLFKAGVNLYLSKIFDS